MWTWVGCIWNAFSSLFVWRSMDSHTWRHSNCHVCLRSKEWACCMERAVVHPSVTSFITSLSLHDLTGPSLCCQCGGYWPDVGEVASSVISQPTCATIEFSVIVTIHKYRRLYEKHHFLSMAMEAHGALKCDMDHFIRECAHLFHDRWFGGHLSLFFWIQIFRQCNVLFFSVL